MRRPIIILVLLLIVVMTVREVYDFFITNEGVNFFSSEPRQIMYVALLGTAGGIGALAINRMSRDSRRRLKLTVLAAVGIGLTAVLGLAAYHLVGVASLVTETGMWNWIAATFVSYFAVVGLVWLEFRQVWHQR